jgi:DNA-binding response OmpR family regulator
MAEKERILIVEDDPDISMIEETYLQAADMRPVFWTMGRTFCPI